MNEKLQKIEEKAIVTQEYVQRMVDQAIAHLKLVRGTLDGRERPTGASVELAGIAYTLNSIARTQQESEQWFGVVQYLREYVKP